MQIKKKIDIHSILDNFTSIAQWDSEGNKYYLVFDDRTRGGQWTLMNYRDNNQYSIHGQGEEYKDEEEIFFEERDQVLSFLWDNRAAYNAAVKKLVRTETFEAV